jgi:hypothetical protein
MLQKYRLFVKQLHIIGHNNWEINIVRTKSKTKEYRDEGNNPDEKPECCVSLYWENTSMFF